MKKTKIICTLGPAVDNPEVLEKLILAGMDVARINFSHGNYQDQEPRIENFKKVREKVGRSVALLLDTKGPEIRIGKFENGRIELNPGDTFTLVNEEILGNQEKVSITYKNLCNEVEKGTIILINDGLIKIEVQEIKGTNIICKVIDGGELTNTKSINIPGMAINLPSPTQKDIEDITFGVKAGFDYIAASFVRTAQDVLNIRKVLEENGGEHIKIISKIENRQGIDNFDEILAVSDGIMVARGDLGVEIPMEEVPIRQKEFISKCNKAGKPVVIATQMLESMIHNPRPTRAEVSDVANAVYDMASCIMLSGESAMGEYPVECVKTMVKIADAVENSLKYWKRFKNREYDLKSLNYEFNLNYSICFTAMQMDAKAIIAYTECGDTPRIIASYLPACPIYAFTSNERTYRQLALYWNVHPFLLPKGNTVNHMLKMGIEKLKEQGKLKEGDAIVIAGGASILKEDETIKDEVNRSIGGVLKL